MPDEVILRLTMGDDVDAITHDIQELLADLESLELSANGWHDIATSRSSQSPQNGPSRPTSLKYAAAAAGSRRSYPRLSRPAYQS